MSIDRERHIKEIYDLHHINDKLLNEGFDYKNNLYNKILSNVLFKNDLLANFLIRLQKGSVWMIDSVLVFRNMFDFSVDKYYDKHNN
jgi:hypothetical protein